MKWDTLPERFFSDEFLDELLKECRIEECFREDIQKGLERAARNWYFQRTSPVNEVSPRIVKSSLLDIQMKAKALRECLMNAPEAIWTELAEICIWTNPSEHHPRFEYDSYPSPEAGYWGTGSITNLAAGPDYRPQSVEVDIFLAALDLLVEKAAYPPTVKQGPQKDRPLQTWIADMRFLWICVFSKPFTRLDHEGQPASEAAHFCVTVYEELSPETSPSRILNEMKKHITEINVIFESTTTLEE